jgi:hypothetical protein
MLSILGSDSFGGVLFKDGLKLVKKLHQGSLIDVKILDLKTGKKQDFDELKQQKGETLVFEGSWFPIEINGGNDIALYFFENCETWSSSY